MQPHVEDGDAEPASLVRHLRADLIGDLVPFVRKQRRELDLSQFAPHDRIDDLRKLQSTFLNRPQRLIILERVGNTVRRVRVDLDPLLVTKDNLLSGRIEGKHPLFEKDCSVEEWKLEPQA